ncbi:glycosyltransferase family 4 protein [Pedobacter ginsengiterrae]|uniref:Glycosyltransferase family 4 protein n=1 Tax=Pedobacter ginsengiterrae TaxID=871696 RepID=A0ABP7QJ27_9SPHI
MNILILNNTSDLYGGSKILSIVVKILAEGEHKPIVVLSESGPLVDELAKLDVDIRIIRLGILRRKYLSVPGILNRLTVTKNAWKTLNKLIDDNNIDLIYSNTTGVFIGAFLAKKRKIKHIWHVHEIITKPKAFTKTIGYLLGKYSDNIIVVSDAVKNHWEKHVLKKPITRIYNGIDTTAFENTKGVLRQELNLSEKGILIAMIGRVNHWKGQDYFIDTAKNILKAHPETKFVMAGDAYTGNEHLVDKLTNRIQNENLADAIQYIGYRTDIANILNSVDIFVLPSILPDPFPTVILEAMASATAVVATNHGGAVEMVMENKTGLLIPFDNAQIAADKISDLIAQPAKIAEMGIEGRKRINNLYSLEAYQKSILEIFQQTLDV